MKPELDLTLFVTIYSSEHGIIMVQKDGDCIITGTFNSTGVSFNVHFRRTLTHVINENHN